MRSSANARSCNSQAREGRDTSMKKSRGIAAAAMVSAALLALATPVATCAETAETNPQDIAASTAAEPATGRPVRRVGQDRRSGVHRQHPAAHLPGVPVAAHRDARPTDKARFHAEAWVPSSGTSSPASTTAQPVRHRRRCAGDPRFPRGLLRAQWLHLRQCGPEDRPPADCVERRTS